MSIDKIYKATEIPLNVYRQQFLKTLREECKGVTNEKCSVLQSTSLVPRKTENDKVLTK